MVKLTDKEFFERFGISKKDEASGVKDYIPKDKEIHIINERSDSVNIKQNAKLDYYFDVKGYIDFSKPNWKEQLDRIFEVKEEVEKRLKEGVK